MSRRSPTRVLIAGAGVAGLETLLALRALAGPFPHVDLLSAESRFRYRPVSVAEPFGRGEARAFDLQEIAADQGAELHRGELVAVDPIRSRVVTRDGEELPYDLLVVAVGARPVEALPGALTFRGARDVPAMSEVLDEIERGAVDNVVFALPPRVAWPLPLYELALLTATHARSHGSHTRITVVTSEEEPLELFGPTAGDAVGQLLSARGVEVLTLTRPVEMDARGLHIAGNGWIPADRVISLPRLEGPAIAGLPHDAEGFIPTDLYGQVKGLSDVYAAGDATSFPLKQGGVAAQQADAVAQSVAARVGASVVPRPFRPVVRGLLLTGGTPVYLRAEPGAMREHAGTAREAAAFSAARPRVRRAESTASESALWWPPSKIAGRYIAPYLATARPVPLASAPLVDRAAPAHPRAADDHDDALELTLILADYDARWGDYALALHALDAAEALAGPLPPEYEERRREWQRALDAGAHAHPV